MNEVKKVIGLLCKHLNTLFHLDLKPEHFRLAKFNKIDENVVSFFCFIKFYMVIETIKSCNTVGCQPKYKFFQISNSSFD